ncbi:unnamed protein product [Meloidogyne enterolobii]|uniref:Uncharacterized protein n=1 Tax=Meloidogyne enterolobii TaxID=390850 RepID=A0ACB0YLN3_MELEN
MVCSLMGRASITPVSRMRTREAMLRRCGSLRAAKGGGPSGRGMLTAADSSSVVL